ncbi:hypothetical protein G7043_42350 [Lentzea sp. NEAU-D13]|uniref:Uncharacterized protein n=1 Tax=Lentzea alba TaxID=2714351 RepID=A0A7C9W114_9PSEU|nr:hypothetical protein [Lentzea alba]NGY65556.1 hypothetical protein [Lentzea alba]
MRPFLSYPRIPDTVELEIVSVSVDGRDLPYSQISRTEKTVALHQTGRGDWDLATLHLKAVLPDQEIADGPWSDVVCLAVLSENSTNVRSTARLAKGRDGTWQGKIELVRGRHLRRAVLSLAVVGEVNGVPGRAIGKSEAPWYLDLKESTPRRQREIKIVEADFREASEEWLRGFKDSAWVVATVEDPEIPIVYLNTSGVEGLVEVLNGTSGSAAEKVLRDTTTSQIAQDAWIAMFHTAVSNLDQDDDGTPIMPTGWQEPVLKMMLPDVLPGRQLTDALREINECRTSGAGWAELQTNIQFAAGKRSQIAKKLTGAVRTVDREERSEP